MEEKVKLLAEYTKKEIEMQKEWDIEEGIDTTSEKYVPESITILRLDAFADYRNIRIKQLWHSKLSQKCNHKETAAEANEMDKERRRRHNLALHSLVGLNRCAEKLGLPKIYDGPELTSEEIEKHNNYQVIDQMTDFFLGLVQEISDANFQKLGIEKDSYENNFFNDLASKVNKTDREYQVTGKVKNDKDDIEFRDF